MSVTFRTIPISEAIYGPVQDTVVRHSCYHCSRFMLHGHTSCKISHAISVNVECNHPFRQILAFGLKNQDILVVSEADIQFPQNFSYALSASSNMHFSVSLL